MNYTKEYIIQVILCASNNLRLSTEKIEIVTLLKQFLEREDDMGLLIFLMKQKTEFSKFAVKLDIPYKYITNAKIDFVKISNTFKEHCHFITQEFGLLLDILSISSTKTFLEELSNSKRNYTEAGKNKSVSNVSEKKEDILLAEEPEKEEFSFEDFESKILKPVRKFDEFLNKLPTFNYREKEINEISDLVKLNGDLAANLGFDIIGEMHHTFFKALKLIQDKKLPPTKELIESMRACLIVIVAVVRRKEVDISKYLKSAESLGRGLSKKY